MERDLIQTYLEHGGAVTRMPTGASNGMRKRDWDRAVRGEAEAGAMSVTELAGPTPSRRIKGTLHIGFGAKK